MLGCEPGGWPGGGGTMTLGVLGAPKRGGGGGMFMMLPICCWPAEGGPIGGGGGGWYCREGSLPETCLWPLEYMLGRLRARTAAAWN